MSVDPSEYESNAEDVLLAQIQPQSLDYQMCDRDIKLTVAQVDDPATLAISGVDANGDVTYTAKKLGVYGNGISIEHSTGATGAGNENRPLTVDDVGRSIDVVFGTDGSGNSVTPTANEIKTAIDADPGASNLVSVAVGGTGNSQSAVASEANLAGGTDNSQEDLKINPTSYLEEVWGEFEQVGVFKPSGGAMVECTDQADATANGTMSVWKYKAIDQADMVTPIKWNLKGGQIWVDGAVVSGFAHRVYAMAGHGLGQPNYIRLFDGYIDPFAGKEVSAISPSAKLLDPDLAPTSSEFKLWVVYPAGSSQTHILRLITYRPKGTF